ncbi:MAG: hypothetical protein IMW98_05950 [Firmicutes bacterium]|nr:hypothetical protein [Bacillota bacterium]
MSAAETILTAEEIRNLLNDGSVLVLDVRPADEFTAAHVRGTVNAPYRRRVFGTLVRAQLDPAEYTLAVLADSDVVARAAAQELEQAGFRVAGHAHGAPESWESAGLTVDRVEEWDVDELAARLQSPEAPEVIDVREPYEWRMGHIQGAKHIPLDQLEARMAELDPERPYALICASGNRSAYAAQLLQARGFRAPINVRGGVYEWARRGHPLER